MKNQSINSKYIALLSTLLAVGAGVATQLNAKNVKNSDSSTQSTPPVYESGVLMTQNVSTDSFASYTDANGKTSSAYCNGTDTTIRCHEGTGITVFLKLPDGSHVQLPYDMSDARDLDHKGWHSYDDDVYASIPFPDPLYKLIISTIYGSKPSILFRLRTAPFVRPRKEDKWSKDTPSMWVWLCVPMNVDVGTQKREDYAKHHSMEACYMIYPSGWENAARATWKSSDDAVGKKETK